MKVLSNKFNNPIVTFAVGLAWLSVVIYWIYSTTDISTYQWAMQNGGITPPEFSAYGKMEVALGLLFGISVPPILKLLKNGLKFKS